MSEEISDTSCITNQATNPEENSPQECSTTDVAIADELFDSFMEIANNPENHNEQTDMQNGTTGEAVTVSETSESISQLKDSSADEQRDTASGGTHDQEESNASRRLSVSQLRDIFNSSSGELQTDTQNRIDDQGETIETDKKSATSETPDQGESTVGESSNVVVSQVKDVSSSAGEEKVDSTESVPATGELNSDDDPVQSATPDQGGSTVEESSNVVVSQGNDVSSAEKVDSTKSVPATGELNSDDDPVQSATPDQGESTVEESSNVVVSQGNDVSSAEKVDSTESVPATGELNPDDHPVQSATPDQGESTVEESSNPVVSQGKDVSSSAGAKKVDSAESVPATGELNSDGDPGQSATEVPTEGSEKVLPVSDESDSSELSATTNSEQSRSHVANGVDRTEELSSGIESVKKSSESSETPVADNQQISADPVECDVDCVVSSVDQGEVSSGNDPTTSGKDVAKRLSEVMENLAGLEQQLSNAMSEMKRSNSEKTFAEKSVETEQKVEMQEGQTLENEPERQVADQTNVTDTMETEVENELSEEKVATDKGCNVASVQQSDDNATACMTDEDLIEVPADSNNKETLEENTDRNDKGIVDDIHIDCRGTDVGAVQAQEVKVGNSESGELDIPVPANEDLKVERNITGTSETADGQVKAGQEADSPMESQTETNISDESKNDDEASSHKSDSMDELDKEVAKVCMSIPDIEITTDESGISEKKSLDSLNTEGSSNSRPASPAFSDEGVDSDTASDYGDDDDGTFDADEASRRKSWLLEIDRDRLSSDSSTVSEKDFKENFDKGDNADGKPLKEDYIRGHLLKMGGTGLTPKNWRKRWFVLRGDNCLYYYKQSKDKVPCGVIILANYSVSKAPEINKNHCLKLTKGGARTYYMCAGSDSDMKKWIMAMMDAIKGSSGSSNPFNLLEGNVHNVSIPALSIRDPDCHGYLYKQGHNIKTWRRRYFVLKNGFLYYYSDMSNTVALGVAKLLNYTIQMGEQSGKKFCFSAVSSQASSRTYYFAAESEMDRTRWSSRLEDSIKKGSLVC